MTPTRRFTWHCALIRGRDNWGGPSPDAGWVKKNGRIIPGYNPHVAVDDTCGMVLAVCPSPPP